MPLFFGDGFRSTNESGGGPESIFCVPTGRSVNPCMLPNANYRVKEELAGAQGNQNKDSNRFSGRWRFTSIQKKRLEQRFKLH